MALLVIYCDFYIILGHYQLETFDIVPPEGQIRDAPTTANSEKGKNGSIGGKSDVSPYKALGCGVNFKVYMESPLVEKSNVTLVNTHYSKNYQVNNTVYDFIPKRNIPPELIQEKRSLKADEEYRIEIQAIVGKLIEEYREAILFDSKTSESDTLQPIISSNQTEEHQVIGFY